MFLGKGGAEHDQRASRSQKGRSKCSHQAFLALPANNIQLYWGASLFLNIECSLEGPEFASVSLQNLNRSLGVNIIYGTKSSSYEGSIKYVQVVAIHEVTFTPLCPDGDTWAYASH